MGLITGKAVKASLYTGWYYAWKIQITNDKTNSKKKKIQQAGRI